MLNVHVFSADTKHYNLSELVMIKRKQSTGLLIKSSYMNQVNSLTSIPHEPIVMVHKATMVANHLHKTGKWDTVTPENKSGKIGSCILGYLMAI